MSRFHNLYICIFHELQPQFLLSRCSRESRQHKFICSARWYTANKTLARCMDDAIWWTLGWLRSAFLCSAARAIYPNSTSKRTTLYICSFLFGYIFMILISQKQINKRIYANYRSYAQCKLSANTRSIMPQLDWKTEPTDDPTYMYSTIGHIDKSA